MGGRCQIRLIRAGHGFLAEGPTIAHFGFGQAGETIDEVTVEWPSGETSVFKGVKSDTRVEATEGQAELEVKPNQRLTLGSAAPAAISLQSLLESNPEGEAGKALLDAQAAHKPLLVNLWAPWCKPCRAEAPLLSAYARQCGESLSYVGLAMNSEYPASKKGAQDIKLTWPISIASQSQARLIDHALEGTPLPTTLLFDADGKLERAIVGKVSEASLQGLHACPDAGP